MRQTTVLNKPRMGGPTEDLLMVVPRHTQGKRLFDIGLSFIGICLAFPVGLLIAAIVKLEDRGPIFYGQERVGQGGRRFRILKFRSMIPDAERATGIVWASENDHRVTGVGRWLRATALDELPQLLNILKGDMSFVGPRAERPQWIANLKKQLTGYDARHVVRPGLTGLAQVYARYDSSDRQKLRYDLLYLRRQSLWLDVRLILVSFWITLRGKWEVRARKF